jgi:HD superfamily phosphohydrolase YqeK
MRHILGTVETSKKLAERFACSEEEAITAALWHDAAREWDEHQLMEAVAGCELLDLEQTDTVLLHAPAAAELFYSSPHSDHLSTDQKIRIYQAIRWHTLANPRMGEIGFILYIADYAEPGRRHITGEERETLFGLNTLHEMMLHVLKGQFAYFAENGIADIAPATAVLYEQLKGKQV